MHCHTAWGRWAVELPQCAGPPTRGMGSPAQEAVVAYKADPLQCTASLPRGGGLWNSGNELPHCLGAVGPRQWGLLSPAGTL